MDVSLDGQHVYVSTGGREFDASLPTVVLVHGAGMDHTAWQFQARAFAYRGINVLSLDLPGHGHSDGAALSTVSEYADVVAALLDEVGVETARIIGISLGAYIAIDLAARFPSKVESIVLLGVAETMPVHPDLLAAAKGDEHLALELMTSWIHARAAHTGGHPTPGLWMMGASMRLLERARPGVLYNDLAACDTYLAASGHAAGIGIPVLVLMGEHDLMTRPAAAAPLAEAFPNARTVIVPGAGHMVMIEEPDTVIDESVQFWQSTKTG
ncbi:MAG: alpha/beta hydrolase [Acidimicrobiia bacterium]|nr:MAG: alpha/beta hydrolase [Acidimicrobiia bacterium]